MITLTIDGVMMPLVQVTLRRDAAGTTLDMQIAGPAAMSIDDVCVLSADGFDPISALVTDYTPGARITTVSAAAAAVVGIDVFAPEHLLYKNESGIRTPVDFAVAPGDTWQGLTIASITTTIGTGSAAFTEVRF